MEHAFAGVDKMIRGTFLPRLFFGKTKTLSPIVRAISTMPINKSRLGLLNPVTPSQRKYLSSLWVSAELVRAVKVGGAFSNADHLRTISEERRDRKKYLDVVHKTKLKVLVINFKGADKRLLLRAKIKGAWLSVRSTTVSGTVPSATDFWGF